MTIYAINSLQPLFSSNRQPKETLQNDHRGSVLFRIPPQFRVFGKAIDKLWKQNGCVPLSVTTFGDANGTDAFQSGLGVLGARHVFFNGGDVGQFKERIRLTASNFAQQFSIRRYDRYPEPESLKKGRFDVDEFVMHSDGSLKVSGLAHSFLALLDVDGNRQGRPYPGVVPTKFNLRPIAKGLLGKLIVGDVNETFKNYPLTPRVITVMNMIEGVTDPEQLAAEIANASKPNSMIALGSNELFDTPKANAFRKKLSETGFKPTETPETKFFLQQMQTMAEQMQDGNHFGLLNWLWRKEN